MKPITLELGDLESDLDPRYLERGRRYFEQGRVIDYTLRRSDGDTIVNGEVRGSAENRYQVYIHLAGDGFGGTVIEGDCSCPVGFNCKHVAATLLRVLAEGETSGPQAGIDAWVERLSTSTAAHSQQALAAPLDSYPGDVDERLLYVLSQPRETPHAGQIEVSLRVGHALAGGGYSRSIDFAIQRAWEPYPPRYLLAGDLAILGQLASLAESAGNAFRLHGASGDRLLEAMLETGRCHWLHPENPALDLGADRAASLEWTLREDGYQVLRFVCTTPIRTVLALAPPWYVDLDQFSCGRIDTGLPATTAEVLAEAPAVAPESVAELGRRLQQALPGQDLPLPAIVSLEELPARRPTPVLRLTRIDDRPPTLDQTGVGHGPPAVRLEFDYAGFRIDSSNPQESPWLRQADGLIRITRDFVVERDAAQRLRTLGLRPWSDRLRSPAADHNSACWVPFGLQVKPEWWFDFQARTLTRLRADGWRVQADADFPFAIIDAGALHGDLQLGRNRDWFELAVDVEVDGERLPLLPLLIAWLDELPPERNAASVLKRLGEKDKLLVPLADGRRLALPAQRVVTILETLIELYDRPVLDEEGRLPFSRWQATQLRNLPLDQPASGEAAADLLELSRRLSEFSGIQTCPPPPAFKARLRPYQQQGLDWLQFLREYGFGGILADDMGLGKTIQTLAHLAVEKAAGRGDRPSLVVAPTSLLFNWRREAAEFAPDLKVLVLHGPDRHRLHGRIARHDLVITSYPLLVRDAEVLQRRSFHLLILDEAQSIKNPRAQVARIAGTLDSRYRLCLTGTPLENHLGELWSLFNFLAPGFLGDERQFRRLFRTPIEKHADHRRQASLAKRVAPFVLRRNKSEVAADLPPKTVILRTVALAGKQRDLYETVRLALQRRVRETIERKGLKRSHIEVLDALLKLRQICCDPRLAKLEHAAKVTESAKLELLTDMLPALIEEGRRVLLFSQFTSMLKLIEEALGQRGLDYVKLTGQTRDRKTPVDRFQNGEVPLFLISLKAGGTGLNLTAADTVIHYDPWWNPAVEDQASDRAHRIGQTRPVFVYKLITEATVEEKILALQQHKRELIDGLFGQQTQLEWSADDLLELLAPVAGQAA